MHRTGSSILFRLGLSMIGGLLVVVMQASAKPDSEQRRQHGSHVHGQGELSVAADGEQLLINLRAPAADLLGFEHAPQNEEELGTLSDLKTQLKDMDGLFTLEGEARCALNDVTFQLPEADGAGSGNQEHNHHEDVHQEDRDHGAHQVYEQHHADIEVTYALMCGAVQSLASLTVNLFDLYPRFSEIEAVYLLEDKQSAHTLNADNRVLRFR